MKIFCTDISETKFENSIIEIAKNSVHLWIVETTGDEKKLSTLRKTFNDDENIRADKFIFEKDRNQFITAHGSLRKILSQYLSVDPGIIQFRKTNNKKPYITFPVTSLKFNISHSQEKILVAVGTDEMGVDIEKIKPGFEFKDFIKSYFSSKEQNAILNSSNANETFYKFWTRKEAVLKATGIGIIDNLKEIEICETENLSNFSHIDLFNYSFKIDDSFFASVCTSVSKPVKNFLRYSQSF